MTRNRKRNECSPVNIVGFRFACPSALSRTLSPTNRLNSKLRDLFGDENRSGTPARKKRKENRSGRRRPWQQPASERDPRPAAKLCARSAGRPGWPRKALLSPRGLACPMARRDASLSLLLPNTRLLHDFVSTTNSRRRSVFYFGSMHACMQCNVFVNRFSLPPFGRSLGSRWCGSFFSQRSIRPVKWISMHNATGVIYQLFSADSFFGSVNSLMAKAHYLYGPAQPSPTLSYSFPPCFVFFCVFFEEKNY